MRWKKSFMRSKPIAPISANTLLNPIGLWFSIDEPIRPAAWGLAALLILSGLASLMAFARLGIQRFWTPEERPSPLLRRFECLPIFFLLGLSVVLTFKAEPLMNYTLDIAKSLNNPERYVMAVMAQRPIPSPEARAALEVQP